jgi:DUF1680 family protein
MLFAILLINLSAPPVPVAHKVADKVLDRFTPAPYSQQRIAGFLAARMAVNLDKRLLRIEEDALLAGFRKRPGSHPWIGEHIGKYLDAAANTYESTGNEQLKTQMTRMALELIKTQLPGGYLGTYVEKERWTSWDVWSHKYNLIGLLAYYRISGGRRALDAAARIGDLLANTFGEGKRDIIASSTHVGMAASSVLEPICQLYRHTGEKRHLEFPLYITRAWEQPNGPKLISALTTQGNAFKTANAKAYEMMSDLAGLLELYRLTGEKTFFDAARNAQADIAAHRRYLTGTVSAHEHFHDDGVLPGEMASDTGEGCATVTWLQLNWQLLRLTGEARYAHELERTVFNQLLAAQDPQDGNICYFTPLNGRKTPRKDINCCRSSEPRGISMIPALVWGSLNGGVAVWQYAPGRAQIGDVVLTAETGFPFSGKYSLTVSPRQPSTFALALRVPEWTSRYVAKVVGKTLRGSHGSMSTITREWRPGDRIDVEMDLTLTSHDGGLSYPGRVAFQRGPSVLALEQSANPQVPYLFRAGVKNLKAEAPGVAFDGQKVNPVKLSLVPFSDASHYQIWLAAPGKLSTAPVPVTIQGKETTSKRDKQQNTGSLTDELTNFDVRVDSAATAWWAVELAKPSAITRVTSSAGPVTERGGWFDTTSGKPQVQIQRVPKGSWETVATLDSYPAVTASALPDIRPGQTFEVKLTQPVQAVAVRLTGKPAREYASITGLSAYN